MIVLSCSSNTTDPESQLLFSRMEIRYIEHGGWTNTSQLFIHKDGYVEGYILSQTKADTVASGDMILRDEDRNDLARLFEPFSSFDPYYEPDNPLTDQDIHTTILTYEGIPDTVTVYMLDEVVVPDRLRAIIEQMEILLAYVTGQ
jgi:hypothetical protein